MFELLHIGERSPDAGDASLAPKEFPLFLDSSERMRFRYGVFLLNKVSNTLAVLLVSTLHALMCRKAFCCTILYKEPDALQVALFSWGIRLWFCHMEAISGIGVLDQPTRGSL